MEARCVECGCTDSRACATGCAWWAVDRVRGIGLCTECIPFLRLARAVYEGWITRAEADEVLGALGSTWGWDPPRAAIPAGIALPLSGNA